MDKKELGMNEVDKKKQLNRRAFMEWSALAGSALLLSGPANLFAATEALANIKSRGYAAFDTSGKLKPWTFERRPVGDHDVLIDINIGDRSNIPRCQVMRLSVWLRRWVRRSPNSRWVIAPEWVVW